MSNILIIFKHLKHLASVLFENVFFFDSNVKNWGFREANTRVLAVGTPPPVTATLSFLSTDDEPLEKASIGDAIQMVVTSEQAGPHNMMLTECTATRVGGEGDAVPFTIIENGLVQHLEAERS